MFKKANLYFFIFCVSVFSFINTYKAHAQLYIGPRAGAQLSWLSFEDKDNKDYLSVEPHIGYNGGFSVAAQVRKRFYLQADFLYSRKGRFYEGKLDPSLKYELVNHYFELPITYRMDFKFNVGKTGGFKGFLGIGPNISYWWKGSGSMSSGELIEANVQKTQIIVEFDEMPDEQVEGYYVYVNDANRVQLGINFVTGVVFEPPSGQMIAVDLRFQLGHSFMAKDSPAYVSNLFDFADPMNTRNMGLVMGVSYMFDTKISQRKRGKSSGKIK